MIILPVFFRHLLNFYYKFLYCLRYSRYHNAEHLTCTLVRFPTASFDVISETVEHLCTPHLIISVLKACSLLTYFENISASDNLLTDC